LKVPDGAVSPPILRLEKALGVSLTPDVAMKLTRFRGHPNICVQGAHDGEDETTLHT
jgi:hypothetical protein